MQDNNRFNVREFFTPKWHPKPLNPPVVDKDIENLSAVARSAESFRYGILSGEYWISPKGQVREWLRNHTRAAVLLAIPAFLVLPIVTFALWQLVTWMTLLSSLAGKLIVFPVLVLLAALTLYLAVLTLKAVFGRH
jgi:hypothetical protein